MREIKFRAYIKKDDVVADVEVISWEEEYVQCRAGEDVILIDFKDIELMQYIGLRDKNGKEIYEGDIVSDGYDKYEVVFKVKKWCASFVLQNITKSWEYGGNGKNIEVVGNIYENKEMLKWN